jgi:hypothetical protein
MPDMPLDHHRDGFTLQRKRIAHKLKNLRLARITFKIFRHWKGTVEYHRIKDIVHAMQTLGHRNIKNTLVHVHLAEALFKDQTEYVSKVAKNETDGFALIEAGFEYVCDLRDHGLFRKKDTNNAPGQTPGNFNMVVRGVGLEPTKAFARGS